ncbi:Crp/Fnr family transcriptional regulator [Jiella sp. MQZ9-1]|uniref:Crp/Fnr family transcriptional regulator n=1 Tax=Jiella flava TaxID=2816857 RepID=A0A939FXE7_9HYPH|nr:Crp/Fnr family transcriptional regulator [Jiella flava]MBO0661930.1 Crp/Fnr family transcriptional regulator [Jiella flava]MCD2470742.1 Crp/Fnr family transcriptional regulator [Jiella flava]
MGANQADKRLDIHNSEVPVVCRACEARHRGICGALTPEQLSHLSRHTTRHRLSRDVEVTVAGEDVHHYSNVLSGVVKLTRLMADGRQQIVGLQFAPDFVGRPFRPTGEVTAEAATNVSLCSFPRVVMDDMIARSPDLERRLYQQALDELDEAREWILTLGRKTAAEKVASFLLMIAENIEPEAAESNGSICFELPLKRADIADFLGLTIETVSRQITKLRKARVIVVENNRSVTVPDIERLRARCEAE